MTRRRDRASNRSYNAKTFIVALCSYHNLLLPSFVPPLLGVAIWQAEQKCLQTFLSAP